jgi:hypothetical protein
VEVDLEGRTLRGYRALRMPGPFAKLEAPFRQKREAARAFRRAVWRFLRRDIHYFAGMNRLFTLFYKAILEGAEPPIPYRDIRRVTWIMDEIFRVCREDAKERDEAGRQNALLREYQPAGV